MQINYILVGMAEMKKTDNTKICRDVEQPELLYTAVVV